MDEEYPGYGARQRYACDFCRLVKKACTRPAPGEACFQCKKSRSPCSPGRTLDELRKILYGRNGVLLHPRFRAGFGGRQATSPPQPEASAFDLGPSTNLHESNNEFNFPYLPEAPFSGRETPMLSSETLSPTDSRLSTDFSMIPDVSAVPIGSISQERQFFNEYGALQIISRYIDRHLCHVDRHLLRTNRTMKALSDCGEVVKSRMKVVLSKIERTGYEADDRNDIDRATWIYQLLTHELDESEMPDNRKRSLLLKISRFYQRTDLHVQAERTLEKIALMRAQIGHQLDAEACKLHAEALEKTSLTTTDAYKNLPQHEVPMELQRGPCREPCPAVHRAFQFESSSLHATSLLATNGRPPPVDLLGQSIIHAAALVGDPDVIKQIFKAFPTMGIDDRDSCRRTPLALAATSGHLTTCQILLENNANKNARNIAGHSILELSARCGHLPIVKLLCDYDADLEPTHMEGTSTALQAAAEGGHIEVVQYLLSSGRANTLFKRSYDQLTAEEIARNNGHNVVGDLIQSWTPLPADSICDIYSP